MSNIETGRPALPLPLTGPADTIEYFGMTLRDYFAAKALVNSFANSTTARDAVRRAYQIADTMPEVRNA